MKRRFRLLASLVAMAAAAALPTLGSSAQPAAAASGEVVILAETVSGGASSTLAQKFVAAGKTPVIKTASEWSAMTAADFDQYDAIVLGDPTCVVGTGPINAAIANQSVWSSVVDGNVVVIGTDETYHESSGGADLMEKASAFSVAEAGKTGAYISLSCYYHDTHEHTPIPLLDGFGTFTATGVGCYNDAHIVATHPALSGLTDATLSNWYCSVHNGFDSWPLNFEVLAIAENIGDSFTAPDGSVGTPYILARGVSVISDITLSPASATNTIGDPHTLSATVTSDSVPQEGKTVTFKVVAGPHDGATGTGVTNSAGVATWSYTGTSVGTDTIEATFVDAASRTQRSNRVTKTWIEGTAEPKDLDLLISDDAHHMTNVRSLEGQVITDGKPMYVFVGPAGEVGDIKQVDFKLDGRRFSTERFTTFDFARTAKNASGCSTCPDSPAFPFESNLLSAGVHEISAVITFNDSTTNTLTDNFTISGTVPHLVQYSHWTNRSNPKPLNASATLSGKRSIFLGPVADEIVGLKNVTFTLDGTLIRTELAAPYDIKGGTASQAVMFDTTTLSNGVHTLVVRANLLGDGVFVEYPVSFNVSN
jgi:hypothetical protein